MRRILGEEHHETGIPNPDLVFVTVFIHVGRPGKALRAFSYPSGRDFPCFMVKVHEVFVRVNRLGNFLFPAFLDAAVMMGRSSKALHAGYCPQDDAACYPQVVFHFQYTAREAEKYRFFSSRGGLKAFPCRHVPLAGQWWAWNRISITEGGAAAGRMKVKRQRGGKGK